MFEEEITLNGSRTGVRITAAETFMDRLTGLMGRSSAVPGKVIKRCRSIHTFFMRFPIDVIFVGPEQKAVKILNGLRPWRLVFPVRGARDTIEIESGTASKLGIKVGDVLTTISNT